MNPVNRSRAFSLVDGLLMPLMAHTVHTNPKQRWPELKEGSARCWVTALKATYQPRVGSPCGSMRQSRIVRVSKEQSHEYSTRATLTRASNAIAVYYLATSKL